MRLLLILFALGSVNSLKFIAYSPQLAKSHVNFMGKISDMLVDAGHEVIPQCVEAHAYEEYMQKTNAAHAWTAGDSLSAILIATVRKYVEISDDKTTLPLIRNAKRVVVEESNYIKYLLRILNNLRSNSIRVLNDRYTRTIFTEAIVKVIRQWKVDKAHLVVRHDFKSLSSYDFLMDLADSIETLRITRLPSRNLFPSDSLASLFNTERILLEMFRKRVNTIMIDGMKISVGNAVDAFAEADSDWIRNKKLWLEMRAFYSRDELSAPYSRKIRRGDVIFKAIPNAEMSGCLISIKHLERADKEF